MYVCIADTLAREPLTGIGPGPFSDSEFDSLVDGYEAQFDPNQRGAVRASGLYVWVEGAPPGAPAESLVEGIAELKE